MTAEPEPVGEDAVAPVNAIDTEHWLWPPYGAPSGVDVTHWGLEPQEGEDR